jgi:hypothetical protein
VKTANSKLRIFNTLNRLYSLNALKTLYKLCKSYEPYEPYKPKNAVKTAVVYKLLYGILKEFTI